MGKAYLRSIAGRGGGSRSSGTRLALVCIVMAAALATISTGATGAAVQQAAAASCSVCGQNLILNSGAEAAPARAAIGREGARLEADRRVYRGPVFLVRGGYFRYVTRPERGARTTSTEVPAQPPPPGRATSPSPRERHRQIISSTSCPGGLAVTATRVTMPPFTRVSRAPTAGPSRNPRSGPSLRPTATAPRNCSSATSRALCRPLLRRSWSNSSCSASAAVTTTAWPTTCRSSFRPLP